MIILATRGLINLIGTPISGHEGTHLYRLCPQTLPVSVQGKGRVQTRPDAAGISAVAILTI